MYNLNLLQTLGTRAFATVPARLQQFLPVTLEISQSQTKNAGSKRGAPPRASFTSGVFLFEFPKFTYQP